jgi:hypothetical protein
LIPPPPKKYAVLASSALEIMMIGALTVDYFTNQIQFDDKIPLSVSDITGYAGMFIGLMAGILICYYVFRSRGWNKPTKIIYKVEKY